MAKIIENAILVYTDGSLYPKGRRGGFAIVFVHVDRIGQETIIDTHSPPGVTGTTNNRMELQASIAGLARVPHAWVAWKEGTFSLAVTCCGKQFR